MESQKPMAPKPAATVSAKVKKEEKNQQHPRYPQRIRSDYRLRCRSRMHLPLRYGLPGNFEGGTTDGHPLNLAGTVYKGGFIVPILMTLLLTVIVLSIERWIAIRSASGKGNTI